jgi:hypothetical protein
MEFRMDHTGPGTITVTQFTNMNDGWLQPTFYGNYRQEFPVRGAKNGWVKTVWNLPHRSPSML